MMMLRCRTTVWAWLFFFFFRGASLSDASKTDKQTVDGRKQPWWRPGVGPQLHGGSAWQAANSWFTVSSYRAGYILTSSSHNWWVFFFFFLNVIFLGCFWSINQHRTRNRWFFFCFFNEMLKLKSEQCLYLKWPCFVLLAFFVKFND